MKNVMMLLLLMAGGVQGVSADDITANDIKYSGTLVDTPPCEINDGNTMEVDFGEVGVNKIGEGNVEAAELARATHFELNCQGSRPDLFIRYLGNPTSFNPAAVQSSVADLGIQLRRGATTDEPLNIGDGWLIKEGSTGPGADYSFISVPVKKPGSELEAGPFEAWASLQLEYP